MISESELVGSIGPLEPEALRRWIDLGWVLPRQQDESLRFDPTEWQIEEGYLEP